MAQISTGAPRGGKAGSVSKVEAAKASYRGRKIDESGRFQPIAEGERSKWAILPVNLRPEDRDAIAAFCAERGMPVARWAREALLAAHAAATKAEP